MAGIYFQIPNIQQRGNKLLSDPSECLMDYWLKHFAKEIEWKAPHFKNKTIKSIYFGGAYPSDQQKPLITKLLEKVRQNFNVQELQEVSLEAYPGSLDLETLKFLKNTGFNRLVLKVYSLSDRTLKNVAIDHSAKKALEIIESSKIAGFDNFSVEMTYGHPYQTYDEWLNELRLLTSYNVPHISAEARSERLDSNGYGNKNRDSLTTFEGFSAIRAFATEHNYHHYEVVNLARKGYESLQNLGYTYREPLLGIGPGAVGFSNNTRWHNYSDYQVYEDCLENNLIPAQEEVLTNLDIVNEKILLGLRSQKGVQPARELKAYLNNMDYDQLMEELAKAYDADRLYKNPHDCFFFNRNYWLEVDDWLSRFFILR